MEQIAVARDGDPGFVHLGSVVQHAAHHATDAERDIDAWATPLAEAGVSVTAIAQRDLHPADGLLGVAAPRKADLLVAGTRGLGGFSSLRAGSVALEVLHRAGLPLVPVPTR